MKKTLSVVLTSAMALSMFSSLAFAAKSSADFTDLKDLDAATKVKFDAMISAGIFDGVSETTFGLKDEMNRAQFAKVAALIMGLDIDKDLKTSSFTDVSVTDEANGYALPYIEALKTAGVTDGYAEGQYNPAGKVTKEQLATFLVRVLGQDEAAKDKTGTDKTVSGWAQGYVALALELKLLANGEDGTFGGQANATRDLLLTGAYEAKQQYVPAGKVSVTGAKAAGVQKVEVTFNKPVDTEKATFELKKGTAAVTLTDAKGTWSADKKTVTLTLKDVKVSEGKYTATVMGLDTAAVEKTSAEFEATDEKVNKIEFVNAGDTVAYGKKVGIKIKASNQYGENASFSAGNYTVFTSNVTNSLKKNDDGTLVLTLNVNDGSNGLIQGNSVVPVNIYNNDSRVSADKTFKVGVAPYATKLELGEVVYSNSNKVISSVGETATINLYQYDQYGNVIAEEDTGSVSNVPNVIVTPYEKALVATEKKFDKVVFGLTEKSSTSGDFDVTVYAGASSATTKVAVKSSQFAKKIEFGDFSGTLAAGDGEKFLPINVYDEEGNKLTADEIIDNVSIINVSGSTGNAALQTSGEHKGEIRIAGIDAGLANGYINVSASIVAPGVNSYVNKNFKVNEARKAETIALDTASKEKAIAGAETDQIWVIKDQYGEKVDKVTGNYSVTVKAEPAEGTTGVSVVNMDAEGLTANYSNTQLETFNDGFTFKTTTGAKGSMKLTATLLLNGKEVDSESRELTVATASEKLTYNVAAVNDLFAAIDNSVTPAGDKLSGDPYNSGMGREVKIEAKDAGGKTVAVPGNMVTGISSSNTSIVAAAYKTADGKARVVGNKAGDASVVVTFKTASGEVKDQTVNVKVKTDAVAVASMSAEASNAYTTNAYTTMELKVTDNYGVEYKYDSVTDLAGKNNIQKYDSFLGIRFSVSSIQLVDKAGTANAVTVNTDGTIAIGANVKEFTLKAIAPNGKTVSTIVTAPAK